MGPIGVLFELGSIDRYMNKFNLTAPVWEKYAEGQRGEITAQRHLARRWQCLEYKEHFLISRSYTVFTTAVLIICSSLSKRDSRRDGRVFPASISHRGRRRSLSSWKEWQSNMRVGL